MAKNYSQIYSAVYTDGNKMNFGNSMIRGNGVPLDITEVYNSLEAAVRYAATNAIAYEGQLLAVTENGDTTVYVITPALQGTFVANPDGEGVGEEIPNYLKPVGTIPVGDGATVTVGEDGKVALVLTGVSDTTKTYVPKLVDGKLVWEVPSATTVEGLDTRLQTVEGKVTTIEGEIDALQTTVGDAESGLVKKVAEIETTLASQAEDIADEAEARELADDAILEKIGAAKDGETAATGLYKTIEDAVAAAVEEVKKYADDGDADTVYDDGEVRQLITDLGVDVGTNTENIAKNAKAITDMDAAYKAADTALETALKQYVGEEIGKQAHFSAKVVTDKAEMTDTTVLYLFKPEGAEGTDVYEQYIVIDGVATLIGETSVDLSGYSTTAKTEELIEAAVSDLDTRLSGTISGVDQKADGIASDLSEFQTTVESTYATQTALQDVADDLSELTGVVGGKAESSAVTALDTRVGEVAADVAENAGQIAELKTVDEGLANRIGALEAVGAEKNVIHSVTTEFTVSEDRQLAIAAVDKSKVTGLEAELTDIATQLAGKVSKQYTEVDGEQKEWILLSPENQTKLAALTVGDTGNIEISGKVNAENVVGLDSYITSKRNSVAGLISEADQTKLNGIAAGAQVNVIEGFSIAGAAITPVSKIIDLPIATQTKLGVVLSSTAENKITVATDGTMEVSSLNVNKLTQTEGDVLILNGGSSL